MANAKEVMEAMAKKNGNIVKMAVDSYVEIPRIPTGILAFDIASGGGFPLGKNSIVYGKESSNKTNIVLRTIAQGQILYPDRVSVFIDVEGTFDETWATQLGVDTDKLILVSPEFAEQAIDAVESFVNAKDVLIVALDSTAMLSTANEIESSAEKASVGGASLLVGKMYRKVTSAQHRLRNDGVLPPAFIAINQIREKIGVMYGNPESLPGGKAQLFASSFNVRVHAKDEFDKKIHPDLPVFKDTSVIIKKWKMPIYSRNATFKMQMISGKGREAGSVDDWNTLAHYMKELGYLSKDKSKWVMCGESFSTLAECKEKLYSDPVAFNTLKNEIIKELMSSNVVEDGEEEDLL